MSSTEVYPFSDGSLPTFLQPTFFWSLFSPSSWHTSLPQVCVPLKTIACLFPLAPRLVLSHNALFWNIKISFYNSGLRWNDLFTSQEKFCSRSICKRNLWSELCGKLWTSRFDMAVCSIDESALFQLCHECLKNCALWRVCKSLLILFSGKRQRMFLLFFSQTDSSLDASVVPCAALRLKGMTSLSDDGVVVLDTSVCDWRFEGTTYYFMWFQN